MTGLILAVALAATHALCFAAGGWYLRCTEVSQQQHAAFLAWNPEARPSRRRRLAAIAGLTVLTSLPWAAVVALLIWSLR